MRVDVYSFFCLSVCIVTVLCYKLLCIPVVVSSGSFPINVWMIGGKRKVVNLSVRTGTAQDIIDKLSTALSSSACNVWHVDKEGQGMCV